MRNVILTKSKNILSFELKSLNDHSALPANDYVELAVSYEDSHRNPLFKKRLMWRIIEGNALLHQPTTLTDSQGLGANRIRVPLDSSDRNTTIRLAVWAQQEPDDKLEFACLFGESEPAPPVASGDVLQTVFPRNDISGRTGVTSEKPTKFSFLYCDGYGFINLDRTIYYTTKPGMANQYTDVYNDYLYVSVRFPMGAIPGGTISLLAQDKSNGLEYNSQYEVGNAASTLGQVNNFWPPNGSLLQPGRKYPIRALCMNSNGSFCSNQSIQWSLTGGSTNGTISPAISMTDAYGIAVSKIECDYVSLGESGDVDLCASVVGSLNDEYFVFDFPSFKIGGDRFVSVSPDTSVSFNAGLPFRFAIVLQDENGLPRAGYNIDWSASGLPAAQCYFDPPVSQTNSNGIASSILTSKDIPQGTVQDIVVTVTPPQGAPYIATYQLVANVVKQIAPADQGPYPIGKPLDVEVMLQDPSGKKIAGRSLVVTPNPLLTISDPNPKTDSNGTAKFQVTASAKVNTLLQVSEYADSVPTSISLSFGTTGIVISPTTSDSMRYDQWISVSASYNDTAGNPVNGASLSWNCTNGVEVETPSTTTVNGISTNRIRYQTVSGFPQPPITTIMTVTASDGTAGEQTWTFTKSGLKNKLQLISPPNESQLTTDTPTLVTLRLTNQFDNPLANYSMVWDAPSDEAVILHYDSLTDSDGIATAIVKGTIPGLVHFTALAPNALGICSFDYDYEEEKLPDCSILLETTFAHNPPSGQTVDPTDNSQIITFVFRLLSNNAPQQNQSILWYFSPRTPDLCFFDGDNNPISADSHGNITTITNADGLCTFKIGSKTRYMGSVSAAPGNNPSAGALQYSIVIATFNSGLIEQSLEPAIYNPNPIAIPDQFSISDAGFVLRIDELQSNTMGQTVVFWTSSGAPGVSPQENILTCSTSQAENGITVPYSYLCPDPTRAGYNSIAYMIVQQSTSTSFLARAITPAVTGSQMPNHPDYNNTDRPLPSPYLSNHANVVNGNNIVNGLKIYIPYSSTWNIGSTINLSLYLNGQDDSGNVFGKTIPLSQTITKDNLNSQKDVIIIAPQDQLSGYNDGTLEADYYIETIWSQILENVTLNTANWH
ncbi:Ig-like domain-containing protein [Brucella anthropi]|uniref:Ig-like domain-containing protein n=1 Tax=Brucella anthropi TaxID=529 RepID=UPI00124E66F0|nr:Ig-like domain-containing protein [Brucella anthropi]KAB2743498.1 hypothetical protein F9L05_23165 [Brucella anthropi]